MLMCLHAYIILYLNYIIFLQGSYLNVTYKPCAQFIKPSLIASTYHNLKRMSTHTHTHIHTHTHTHTHTGTWVYPFKHKKHIPQSPGKAWPWSQQARMTQQFYKTRIVNTHTPAVESIKRPLHTTTTVLPDPSWPIKNEDRTSTASIG